MKVIGVTGGIGSGKSTVAQFLTEMGAVVLDADKIGHELLKSNNEVRQQLVATFGEQILDPDSDIDRKKLGRIVFDNPEARTRLNQIIHPPIYEMVKARLEEYRRQGVGVVVLDVPLLLDAGWDSLVNEVWVSTAPEATILKRLKKRTGLSKQESLARIRSQLPTEERLKRADVVINTNCSLEELKAEVKKLWLKLQT